MAKLERSTYKLFGITGYNEQSVLYDSTGSDGATAQVIATFTAVDGQVRKMAQKQFLIGRYIYQVVLTGRLQSAPNLQKAEQIFALFKINPSRDRQPATELNSDAIAPEISYKGDSQAAAQPADPDFKDLSSIWSREKYDRLCSDIIESKRRPYNSDDARSWLTSLSNDSFFATPIGCAQSVWSLAVAFAEAGWGALQFASNMLLSSEYRDHVSSSAILGLSEVARSPINHARFWFSAIKQSVVRSWTSFPCLNDRAQTEVICSFLGSGLPVAGLVKFLRIGGRAIKEEPELAKALAEAEERYTQAPAPKTTLELPEAPIASRPAVPEGIGTEQSPNTNSWNRKFGDATIASNLALSDGERLSRLTELAGGNERAAKALLQVHNNPSSDKLGPTSGRLGYKGSKKKFDQAVDSLVKAGLNKDQARKLASDCIRSGLCGEVNPEASQTLLQSLMVSQVPRPPTPEALPTMSAKTPILEARPGAEQQSSAVVPSLRSRPTAVNENINPPTLTSDAAAPSAPSAPSAPNPRISKHDGPHQTLPPADPALLRAFDEIFDFPDEPNLREMVKSLIEKGFSARQLMALEQWTRAGRQFQSLENQSLAAYHSLPLEEKALIKVVNIENFESLSLDDRAQLRVWLAEAERKAAPARKADSSEVVTPNKRSGPVATDKPEIPLEPFTKLENEILAARNDRIRALDQIGLPADVSARLKEELIGKMDGLQNRLLELLDNSETGANGGSSIQSQIDQIQSQLSDALKHFDEQLAKARKPNGHATASQPAGQVRSQPASPAQTFAEIKANPSLVVPGQIYLLGEEARGIKTLRFSKAVADYFRGSKDDRPMRFMNAIAKGTVGKSPSESGVGPLGHASAVEVRVVARHFNKRILGCLKNGFLDLLVVRDRGTRIGDKELAGLCK